MRRTMLCLAVFATALTLTGCGRTDPVEIPFTASCASSPPKLNQDAQALFMPAKQSLHNATVRKRGVTSADLARIQTKETKALLASVGNDRQRLLLQWMFYVNGSDQMKKDMESVRGEEGWVYMMTFVYHCQGMG